MSVDLSGPTLITFLKRALARCITHKKRLATKAVASHRLYPRGESNPYLKFRKLLFYPLNYKTNFLFGVAKVESFLQTDKFLGNENRKYSFYRGSMDLRHRLVGK